MSQNRPEIPEGLKREVRQRCGFGCVICGLPVYHYDHMDEYSVVQEHAAVNITLLCGYHHDLKTRRQLPTEFVRAMNSKPRNVFHRETAGHALFYFGDYAEIIAGGNRVVVSKQSASAIRIDGHSLMDFELADGNLMLNIDLRDRDGAPVLTVRQNELVHSTHFWDYEFKGRRLSIRQRQGQIYLTVSFEADRHRVVVDKGLVTHNGVDVLFDPRGLCILNNCFLLSGSSVDGMQTAISVGEAGDSAGPAAMRIQINRGPYDQNAALAWARKHMAENARQRRNDLGPGGHPQMRRDLPTDRPIKWMSITMLPYPWTRLSCGQLNRWP